MKENKITVRLNDTQYALIQQLIDEGKAKTPSAALQLILNKLAILGGLNDC
ncbi:hypothetical protein [Serratia marcescens]|uniref:hypothetical protein n=1 Tax=Serratia marcescens TaxID=615 RepID=UPI001E2E4318|nr:hypothetical protein [Serratia marcescens]